MISTVTSYTRLYIVMHKRRPNSTRSLLSNSQIFRHHRKNKENCRRRREEIHPLEFTVVVVVVVVVAVVTTRVIKSYQEYPFRNQ